MHVADSMISFLISFQLFASSVHSLVVFPRLALPLKWNATVGSPVRDLKSDMSVISLQLWLATLYRNFRLAGEDDGLLIIY